MSLEDFKKLVVEQRREDDDFSKLIQQLKDDKGYTDNKIRLMFVKEWRGLDAPEISDPLYYFLHSPKHMTLYKKDSQDDDPNSSWEYVHGQGEQPDAPQYILQFRTRIDDRIFGSMDIDPNDDTRGHILNIPLTTQLPIIEAYEQYSRGEILYPEYQDRVLGAYLQLLEKGEHDHNPDELTPKLEFDRDYVARKNKKLDSGGIRANLPQDFLPRYIHPLNPIVGLLLLWWVGAGKTCGGGYTMSNFIKSGWMGFWLTSESLIPELGGPAFKDECLLDKTIIAMDAVLKVLMDREHLSDDEFIIEFEQLSNSDDYLNLYETMDADTKVLGGYFNGLKFGDPIAWRHLGDKFRKRLDDPEGFGPQQYKDFALEFIMPIKEKDSDDNYIYGYKETMMTEIKNHLDKDFKIASDVRETAKSVGGPLDRRTKFLDAIKEFARLSKTIGVDLFQLNSSSSSGEWTFEDNFLDRTMIVIDEPQKMYDILLDEIHDYGRMTLEYFLRKAIKRNRNDGNEYLTPRIMLLTATPIINNPDGLLRMLRLMSPLDDNRLPVGRELAELLVNGSLDGDGKIVYNFEDYEFERIMNELDSQSHLISHFNPSNDRVGFAQKDYRIFTEGQEPTPGIVNKIYDCRGSVCRISFNEYIYEAVQACRNPSNDNLEKYSCLERVRLDSRLKAKTTKKNNPLDEDRGKLTLGGSKKYQIDELEKYAPMIYGMLKNIERIDVNVEESSSSPERTRKHFIYVNSDSSKDGGGAIKAVLAGMLAYNDNHSSEHAYRLVRPQLKMKKGRPCPKGFTPQREWGYTREGEQCFQFKYDQRALDRQGGKSYLDRRNVVILTGETPKLMAKTSTLYYDNQIQNSGKTNPTFKFNDQLKNIITKTVNNRDRNMFGQEIRFVIADKHFKAGLNLKDFLTVHILGEPETESDLTQIVGRIIRYNGIHSDLWDWDEDTGLSTGTKVMVFVYRMCATDDCAHRVREENSQGESESPWIRYMFEYMIDMVPTLSSGKITMPTKSGGAFHHRYTSVDPLNKVNNDRVNQYSMKWNEIQREMIDKAKDVACTSRLFENTNKFNIGGDLTMSVDDFIPTHLGYRKK